MDREELLRLVGDRIRRLRLERGLTQEGLAEAAGLHRTYVGSLERGERNVATLNLYALGRALGVDAGALLPRPTAAGERAGGSGDEPA